MAKTYSFYGAAFDDFVVLPTGGLHVDLDACKKRKPYATSDSPRELQHATVERQRKCANPHTTGVWTLKPDPVNDCTYVICGNHFFDDFGVIIPMITPDDWD